MKILFEFFPIILFFIAFKVKGIYVATAVAIAASVLQIAFSWLRTRKVEPMLWISFAVILVFGGSTLLLHNEMFIKWKPTILYWIFAGIIAVAKLSWNKNILRVMLQKQLTLPDPAWEKLNGSWAAFFTVVGAVNLFVAYRYSTAVWVNFKLFGLLGCMLVFAVLQGIFLSSYIEEKNGDAEKNPEP